MFYSPLLDLIEDLMSDLHSNQFDLPMRTAEENIVGNFCQTSQQSTTSKQVIGLIKRVTI